MKTSTRNIHRQFQTIGKTLADLACRLPGRPMACVHCVSVLEWLKSQNLPATASEFTLPPRLAHMAATGTASGLRTRDGRFCVLLKTTIGWKGNFQGIFCSDGPLLPSEIIGGATRRAYISIGDEYLFQELYIRRRYSDRCFAVYFDLN